MLPSFYSNAQNFIQNDGERIRVHQILNEYSITEIPTENIDELKLFFTNNKISKPESEKYQYLLRALFDKKNSAEDWRFFYSFLLKSFSANDKFPIIILKSLKICIC
jgi:fructose-1,6-bisphosphatase